MTAQYAFEEPLGCSVIPAGLEIHIYHFAILINSPPKVMLFAVDLDDNLIDKEDIAVSIVPSLQAP
jgi:hypothetical protein